MVVNEIHGNISMRMVSVTYNTHTHTSRIIYRLACPENIDNSLSSLVMKDIMEERRVSYWFLESIL